MMQSRAMAHAHVSRDTPDITPQAYVLDGVLEGICRGSGTLYGTKFRRDDCPCIFISSLEPRPGLEVVASGALRPGLPRLVARGNSWALRLPDGRLIVVTTVANP